VVLGPVFAAVTYLFVMGHDWSSLLHWQFPH
jgi:hypothetical protein